MDLASGVYALVDPIDFEVFYIGFTTDTKKRIKQHQTGTLSVIGNQEAVSRILKIKTAHRLPRMLVLEKTADKRREQIWIKYLNEQGLCLTNKVGSKAGLKKRPRVPTGNDLRPQWASLQP